MRHSFYHFALTYRGGSKNDVLSTFSEAMFLDHTFPKQSESFEELSRYIEEAADEEMSAIIFDDFWVLYAELEKQIFCCQMSDNPVQLSKNEACKRMQKYYKNREV